MKVRDIMTESPACCAPGESVQDAARKMIDHDCGELPVVDQAGRPVGVVTDRDICCRAVAEGKAPQDTSVQECMTSPAVTVTPETSVEDCCRALEENMIRRVPVVDESGSCCGIVSQADIAEKTDSSKVGQVVKGVSKPTEEASRAEASG